MKYVFSFIAILLMVSVQGQEAQRTSLGMSGGTYLLTDGESEMYVSQSIGQNGVIGSFQGEEYAVRQGFQQPPIYVVPVTQNDDPLDAVVYPNPVITAVTIKFNESIDQHIEGKLFDVLGKEVLYKSYEPAQTVSMDLNHLPTGTYLLVVGTGQRQFTSRLIKN